MDKIIIIILFSFVVIAQQPDDNAIKNLSPHIDEIIPIGYCGGYHTRLIIFRGGQDDILARPYLQWMNSRGKDTSKVIETIMVKEVVGMFDVSFISKSFNDTSVIVNLDIARIGVEGKATLIILKNRKYSFSIDTTWFTK